MYLILRKCKNLIPRVISGGGLWSMSYTQQFGHSYFPLDSLQRMQAYCSLPISQTYTKCLRGVNLQQCHSYNPTTGSQKFMALPFKTFLKLKHKHSFVHLEIVNYRMCLFIDRAVWEETWIFSATGEKQ